MRRQLPCMVCGVEPVRRWIVDSGQQLGGISLQSLTRRMQRCSVCRGKGQVGGSRKANAAAWEGVEALRSAMPLVVGGGGFKKAKAAEWEGVEALGTETLGGGGEGGLRVGNLQCLDSSTPPPTPSCPTDLSNRGEQIYRAMECWSKSSPSCNPFRREAGFPVDDGGRPTDRSALLTPTFGGLVGSTAAPLRRERARRGTPVGGRERLRAPTANKRVNGFGSDTVANGRYGYPVPVRYLKS